MTELLRLLHTLKDSWHHLPVSDGLCPTERHSVPSLSHLGTVPCCSKSLVLVEPSVGTGEDSFTHTHLWAPLLHVLTLAPQRFS